MAVELRAILPDFSVGPAAPCAVVGLGAGAHSKPSSMAVASCSTAAAAGNAGLTGTGPALADAQHFEMRFVGATTTALKETFFSS